MTNKLLYPEEINERVKNGMGCGSHIGEGWFDIVRVLDASITKLYPDYVVDQVKEKFGGLRYYIGSVPKEHFDEVYKLIHAAEAKSEKTCDVCGETGELSNNGWFVTRCEKHRKI